MVLHNQLRTTKFLINFSYLIQQESFDKDDILPLKSKKTKPEDYKVEIQKLFCIKPKKLSNIKFENCIIYIKIHHVFLPSNPFQKQSKYLLLKDNRTNYKLLLFFYFEVILLKQKSLLSLPNR